MQPHVKDTRVIAIFIETIIPALLFCNPNYQIL